MNIVYETERATIDLGKITDAEEISHRFMMSFPAFMNEMKTQAVKQMLPQELKSTRLVNNADFVSRVIENLDDSALIEKPNVFLSVSGRE